MMQDSMMMNMPMGMPMGFTSMTGQKNQVLSALKELVNADEIVENVRYQLSGKKIVKFYEGNEEKTMIREYHKPLMNDEGISDTVADFRAFINSNMILSWYEQKEIDKWSYVYFTNVIFNLARNMHKYDVKTRENHAKIRMILHSNFRSVMGRAMRGMTLLTALKNIETHEVRNFEQERNPSLFGIFNRRGGGA